MDKNKFEYTYSAPTKSEREQIEDIRKNYLPKSEEESKLSRLKKLHSKVKNIPCVWGLSVGIFGVLLFGLGLAMVLEWNSLVFGIVVSVIGCLPMAIAYPIYKKSKDILTNKNKGEILRLSEELLNEDR